MAAEIDDIRFGLHWALRKSHHDFNRPPPRSTGARLRGVVTHGLAPMQARSASTGTSCRSQKIPVVYDRTHDVDWSGLFHASGPASDTPRHLVALLGKDARASVDGYSHLWDPSPRRPQCPQWGGGRSEHRHDLLVGRMVRQFRGRRRQRGWIRERQQGLAGDAYLLGQPVELLQLRMPRPPGAAFVIAPLCGVVLVGIGGGTLLMLDSMFRLLPESVNLGRNTERVLPTRAEGQAASRGIGGRTTAPIHRSVTRRPGW
jgi:hypothetical protein